MSYGDPIVPMQLADLLPRLVGKLPGCPPSALRQQLAETAEAFCRETGALRCIVGPFDFTEGECTYPIELPIPATVNVVHKVFIRRDEQHPSAYTLAQHSDCATEITFRFPPPRSTTPAVWAADVSMIPHPGCDRYPSSFLTQWSHAIIAGTLAALMEDNTKRWHNPALAAQNAKTYWRAKQDATFRRLQAESPDGKLSFRDTSQTFAGNFC